MKCCCFGTSTNVLQKKRDEHARRIKNAEGASIAKTKNFTYRELSMATNNFHRRNRIGRGGFGTVYKGVLKNGVEVAVKTLSAESKQGAREFLTEINTISNVKHPNLVELVGCCVHGPHKILVYEYIENSSLERALLGSNPSIKLDWEQRSAICLGTARGLAYLHGELETPIVHRDIKASNILLDEDFQPKIGDFGLAKLFPDNITHISTQIAGTTGYLAPEYVFGGHLTVKADVYSFGVLILEVLSGQSSGKTNYGGTPKLLVEWAWELHEEGKLLNLVDPQLDKFPEGEILRYMKVAFFCTQAKALRRPLMSQVIQMLTKNVQLNEKQLTPPGYVKDSGRLSGKMAKNIPSESSTSYQVSYVPSLVTEVNPR